MRLDVRGYSNMPKKKPTKQPRCCVVTKSKKKCKNPSSQGSKYCSVHNPANKKTFKKSRQRGADANKKRSKFSTIQEFIRSIPEFHSFKLKDEPLTNVELELMMGNWILLLMSKPNEPKHAALANKFIQNLIALRSLKDRTGEDEDNAVDEVPFAIVTAREVDL